ncbi:nitroreductase family protein [Cohnella cellulosilytica]|uniref:Nitroreductase family protein n=1 Tax=Cohnella cellulosilytica TaxID=986710 RepID=A0ABW2FLR4_9BACL
MSATQQKSELSRLVRERRSIRNFAKRALSRELVVELLQAAEASTPAAQREPSHRFILVASPEGKAKAASLIMDTYAEQGLYKWIPNKLNQLMADRIAQIPAFLIVIAKDSGEGGRELATVSAVLQSLALLAWEQGIGAVWNTEPFMHKPSFTSGIGLRADERIVTILYLGYCEKTPKTKPRTPAASKLTHL